MTSALGPFLNLILIIFSLFCKNTIHYKNKNKINLKDNVFVEQK